MSQGQAAGDAFDATTRRVMPEHGVVHARLLRHGEVDGFERREVRGQIDAALTPRGLRQHERLVAWMAATEGRPDVVLCSDLSRCRDLGARLADATGADLVLDARWREQDMGAWEGRTWAEISAEHGPLVNDYWDDYVRRAPPGGESLEQLAARVLAAWRAQVLDAAHERVWLVSHVGVLRVLLCDALGLPIGDALRFAPSAASCTSLALAAAGAVLQGMGERPWFDASFLRPAAPEGPPRIALSGSAGTGKTTLGRSLAEALSVPFLEEPMRARLEDGLDLHTLTHAQMRTLLLELWEHQRAAEDAAADGFVADRSSADYAAFWIHYGFHHDAADTEPRMTRWLAHLRRYDRVVLLPWGVLPLEHDGVRSTNRWIQFMFQSLVEGLLNRHAPVERLLRLGDETDLVARRDAVLGTLG
ncbi:MAG: histidine phosphatase family protein [Planctomycetes bacterium]|nr:histidine phosphatase family protein [Planctomycetota bacterium]